jgi:hypothetical protein
MLQFDSVKPNIVKHSLAQSNNGYSAQPSAMRVADYPVGEVCCSVLQVQPFLVSEQN